MPLTSTGQRPKWVIPLAVVGLAAVLVAGQLWMTRPDRGERATSASDSGSATSSTAGPSATPSGVLPPLPPYQRDLAPVAPTEPAKADQPLPPLSSAPPGLISGYTEKVVEDGTAFKILFRPWGMGPNDTMGRTVAATVYDVTPLGDAGLAGLLKRKNILLVMDASDGGTVSRGGTYRAILTFRSGKQGRVPVISKVEPNSP